ncbi:glycosyltransferase family 2 protein [Vibrio sp. AND4]|uniref:glycosyltransferase family 2 protein n=1 Tax=Vibrio sp. AND4 TaxID=314289 RepID=UPI00015F06C8|nr:glycosyltransferase family 2 protein [Vibrio sp. AND4]EDP57491.1 glycosyl transferase, family 2 [Vibrio sp. AND4]
MRVFLSVVSHGHSELIHQLDCLTNVINDFEVVVKSNKPDDNFSVLNESKNFHWIDEQYFLGFGNNNNIVFDYCRSKLGMREDDYFIVLNPDVVVSSAEIYLLIENMEKNRSKLSAINLYKDYDMTIYDDSIRKFPSFIQFAKSFLGLGNSAVLDKNMIRVHCFIDWAAGSFLAFKVSHYVALSGFDENYFMYCEDIDICYRSHLLDERVLYFPEIKAVHLAKHANRKILSKHFYWHVTSVVRFLLTKAGLTKSKSSLSQ